MSENIIWHNNPEFNSWLEKIGDLDFLEICTKDNMYKGYFTNGRVDRNTLPEGLYAYDIRGGDEIDFCTLEPNVCVNHTGTFICDIPVPMNVLENEYWRHKEYIDIVDWNFAY